MSTAAVQETPSVRGDGLVLGPWLDHRRRRGPGDRRRPADPRVVIVHAHRCARRPTPWTGCARAPRTTDRVDWAVRDAATGRSSAGSGLHRFDQQSRSAEIGYGVHPAHRRRGVALRAVSAASSYAFTTLNLARISLVHATGNPAPALSPSQRLRVRGRGAGRPRPRRRRAARRASPCATRHRRRPAPSRLPRPGASPVTIDAGDLTLRPWTEDDADGSAGRVRRPADRPGGTRACHCPTSMRPAGGWSRGRPGGRRRVLLVGGGRRNDRRAARVDRAAPHRPDRPRRRSRRTGRSRRPADAASRPRP